MSTRGRLFSSLLSALLIGGCALQRPSAASAPPVGVVHGEVAEQMDGFLTSLVPYGFSGAVLVESHGQVILSKGYGFADRQHRLPFTTRTPSEIGSLTKQFTAALIFALAGQGRLSLDDSLPRFFSDVPPDKAGITIRTLLSHTAGLVRDAGPYYTVRPRGEVVREIFRTRLRSRPGERHFYSNVGYRLLAAILETVTGDMYERLAEQRLFRAAGMTNTHFYGQQNARAFAIPPARMYTGAFDRGSPSDLPGPSWYMRGNGGVVSTIEDLFRWERSLRDRAILGDSLTAELFAPRATVSPGVQYAAGWFVRDTLGHRVIEHGGDFALGTNSEFVRVPSERSTLLIVSNGASANGLSFRTFVQASLLRALLTGEPPTAAPPARLLSSADVVEVSGAYVLADSSRIEVATEGTLLWAGAVGQRAVALLAGQDTGLARRAERANARTAAMLDRLVRGDTSALADALTARFAQSYAEYVDEWHSLSRSHGTIGAYVVTGAIGLQRAVEVHVNLYSARDTVPFIYIWGNDPDLQLYGSGPGESIFATSALLTPTGPGQLAVRNNFNGRVRHFRIGPGRDGFELCAIDPPSSCARRAGSASILSASLKRVYPP